MASAPTIRAVGTIASGTTTIAPGLPSGTTAGDLLLMFLENDGSEAAPTASGWTQLLTKATGADTTDTRLTVLYKTAAGSDATTTNDPGDHIVGRIIGITAGTWAVTDTFNATQTSNEDAADTSGSITGVTTTLDNCLVLAACTNGDDPAANGTANYGSWTNANLSSLTERIDNTRTSGNGGGIGVASGILATAGATGATTVTLGVASFKAMATIAIAPLHATGSGAITLPKAAVAGTGTHPESGVRHVQHLGESEYSASASTTSDLSISKTVTEGNFITVAITYYGALGSNESAVDNLGNSYSFAEHAGNGTTTNTAILTAPVTTGGTLTTITVTHSSRQYRSVTADEWAGVGAVSTLGAGSSGSGTTSTWVNNKTIPQDGAAVGYVGSNTTDAMSAGSASGSPSTSITRVTHYPSPGSASMSMASLYARANAGSAVTSFSGTATHASISWSSAGVVLEPTAAAPTGTGATTLAPAAAAGSGTQTITGAGATILAPATTAGTGIGGAVGTGALASQAATIAATGAETMTATGASTLAPAAASGSGAETLTATGAAILAPASITTSGTETLTGAGALATQPVTLAGAGVETITASGAATLAPASASGTASETISATGALTLQQPAVAGVGDHTGIAGATGDGAMSVQPAEADGVGTLTITGAGAIAVVAPTMDGTGLVVLSGSGGATLAPASIASTGAETLTGSGSITTVAPTLDGTAVAVITLTGAGALTARPAAVAGVGDETIPTWSTPSIAGPGSTASRAGPAAAATVIGPSATATVTTASTATPSPTTTTEATVR